MGIKKGVVESKRNLPLLSIVLPYHNPDEHWENAILNAYKIISETISFCPELIIINDGSTKSLSQESLQRLSASIPDIIQLKYPVNKGKGAALRLGISKASGEKIIYTDIDFPYTSESFFNIWNDLQHNDVVIGVKDQTYYKHVPKVRIFISKILRKLIRALFHIPITDTQCGLKGFNQNGKKVFLQTTINRYLCDLEFVYLCFKKQPKLKITQQEIQLKPEVKFSKMHLNILFAETINLLSIICKTKITK